MSPRTKREVRAFAEALFSDGGTPPPSQRLDWLCDEVEDFVEQAGTRTRLVLEAGLFVATWLAPAASGARPPLERMPIPERSAALEKMESTSVGLAILGVKAMVCILYYEHPDALAEMGADVSCLGVAGREPGGDATRDAAPFGGAA